MTALGLRLLASLAGVVLITAAGYRLLAVNATTQGFAYLLWVLILASTWGFIEAVVASVAATLALNFFFFEPIGTLTIEDPRNWVALFSFLATSLIAGRVSDQAKQKAMDAVARQQDLERLYTFSRAILLIGSAEPFAKQLAQKIAEIFGFTAVVLYDRRADDFYRAGPAEFDGLDDQLREAALLGTSYDDPLRRRVITAVRLGAEPIAGLALQGAQPISERGVEMPDSVVQGISNLVAIGLERARAQDLASQVEAARQSEKLRTTLIDAMAHELKTPLTSIMAATTALLSDPDQSPESRAELVKIADEEARHLKDLIDDSLEMARLDTANIQVQPEPANLSEIVHQVVAGMRGEIDTRPVEITGADRAYPVAVDPRLMRLAIKQLVDNALKYSPPDTPLKIDVRDGTGVVSVGVTDHGAGIPTSEQDRIFQRLYRSPAVTTRIPGSGLGLSIAQDIVRAHRGNLEVASRPGETTFRLTLPVQEGAVN